MPTSQSQKKEAIAQATEQELASLAGRGVRIAGNACSPIVLVKGDLDDAERAGGELAAGPDGAALRKALGAIGYAPEDFCVLASVAGAGDGAVATGEGLPCELFREALEALDPEAVLLLDDRAADTMRETYADMLVAIDDFDTAMLKPGLVAHVQGRRVLALDGFEAALTDKAAKQRMWAYIKQLTPAAAPLHHGAKLKPVAVDAKLVVAVHAFDGKLNALGSKAVSGVPGYGHAVDHARRAPKDSSCAIESSTILSLPVRKWTCRITESLFQLYT